MVNVDYFGRTVAILYADGESVQAELVKNDMGLIRMITDRGEYCGKVESHDFKLYLGVTYIEHTKTKARYPQTNGICERFHKTILHEFYNVAFHRKIYQSLEELQTNLDVGYTITT